MNTKSSINLSLIAQKMAVEFNRKELGEDSGLVVLLEDYVRHKYFMREKSEKKDRFLDKVTLYFFTGLISTCFVNFIINPKYSLLTLIVFSCSLCGLISIDVFRRLNYTNNKDAILSLLEIDVLDYLSSNKEKLKVFFKNNNLNKSDLFDIVNHLADKRPEGVVDSFIDLLWFIKDKKEFKETKFTKMMDELTFNENIKEKVMNVI